MATPRIAADAPRARSTSASGVRAEPTTSAAPARLAALATSLAALALYLPTMARAIGFIDRGELAAVAATLGIAHPTGYPTLTLLGHAATRIAPGAPLLALSALAALLVAAGAGVLALCFDRVLALLPLTRGAAPLDARARAACAGLAALLTAVTATWWQQANGFEAYALHALMLPLVLWTFTRYAGASDAALAGRRWTRGSTFALITGLALTNHLTTVVIAPGLLVAFFARFGAGRRAAVELARLAPPFLLGLLPYVYLPWRAAMDPRFAWGDPDAWWRFVAHASASQYRVWMFSDAQGAWNQLRYFGARLPWEWAWAGLALAALGVWRMRGVPVVLLATLLAAAGSLVYAAGYAIRDIDAYLMAAVAAGGVLVAAGLAALAERAGARLAIGAGVALVAASVALHRPVCDEHDLHLVEDYARAALAELPPNAMLVSGQWDYLVAATYWLQEGEGVRRDVTVVSPELMRRSWYLDELARRAPELAAAAREPTAVFRREVEPFERGRPFEGPRIQAAYEAMLDAWARAAIAHGGLHVTWEMRMPPWDRWLPTPMGLSVRLGVDTTYVAMPVPSYPWRPWSRRRDHYVATMSRNYAEALGARAAYELARGRPDRARAVAEYALNFAPPFAPQDVPTLPFDGNEIVDAAFARFEGLRMFVGR